MGRRIAALVVVAFALVSGLLVLRAVSLKPPSDPVTRVSFELDGKAALQRLQGAIRFQTISTEEGVNDPATFRALHAFLEQSYPLAHKALQRERVNDLSLLYVWPGRDSSKAPIVLMGHIDVVPIAPGTEGLWSKPPFDAAVEGDWVYGRGTLDDKSTVISVLESVEHLLREGFVPERTVILQFGHDEERGGREGAKAIVATLVARGVKPALVVDEGGALMDGKLIGARGLSALVGIAEKGFVSLELSVSGDGGHSSAPPRPTHIGRLAAAIARIEARPFEAKLEGAAREMIEAAAPYMPFGLRLAVANLWLTRPLVTRAIAARSPLTAAIVRTTTAPTIFQAGNKENVLPPTARAVVNFRILPGETAASVKERIVSIVADDKVQIHAIGASFDPSPVSDSHAEAYRVLSRSIRETLGDQPPAVLPFLMMGGTDARYWAEHTPVAYRFNPFPVEEDVVKRAHGTDERLSIRGFVNGVRFYVQLIKNAQALP